MKLHSIVQFGPNPTALFACGWAGRLGGPGGGGQAAKNGMLVPKKGGHLTFHGGLLPFDRACPLISWLLNVVRKIW